MSLDDFGRTVVLAPHPDDETLGCGATLLRLGQETSHPLHWVVMTRMTPEGGFDEETMRRRDGEIEAATGEYGFASREDLPFAAASLDSVGTTELISTLAAVFDRLEPETVLLPFPDDAHSDHRRCFQTAVACTKWFRRPYLRRTLCYEVLSETGHNLDPTSTPFRPDFYVGVDPALVERKIEIMRGYESEMSPFPFPRSEEAIRALAQVRGSECGSAAAEAFVLVRENRPA